MTLNFGYGLGWFISDVKGHQIQHTGGLIPVQLRNLP